MDRRDFLAAASSLVAAPQLPAAVSRDHSADQCHYDWYQAGVTLYCRPRMFDNWNSYIDLLRDHRVPYAENGWTHVAAVPLDQFTEIASTQFLTKGDPLYKKYCHVDHTYDILNGEDKQPGTSTYTYLSKEVLFSLHPRYRSLVSQLDCSYDYALQFSPVFHAPWKPQVDDPFGHFVPLVKKIRYTDVMIGDQPCIGVHMETAAKRFSRSRLGAIWSDVRPEYLGMNYSEFRDARLKHVIATGEADSVGSSGRPQHVVAI